MSEFNITVEGGKSVRLPTAGKYCDRDIVITAEGGTEELNAVLTEQESLIAELQNTLRGKASGGGLDVLPTLEFTTKGAYYGKPLGSFGNQKLVTLLTLKKGKSVPAGYFGTIYQNSGGGTVAAWAVNGGKFNAGMSVTQITPSDHLWVMVGCYPGNQETWDAFMDAFEVRTELICEEL